MRGVQIQFETVLVTETCCNCGMLFAMPAEVQQHRKTDHAMFYCPAGHSQFYSSKSEADKLKDELAKTKRSLETAKADYEYEYKMRRTTERSLSAAKGVLTRTKNRIANGVCPCCNRSFANLHRHMQGKHPEYQGES